MKADVLRLIRDSKDYVSKETISEACAMTPVAVAASVNQLVAAGYDIEYDKEKGYHLISYPENITSVELMSRTTTNWAGKLVIYRKETESTNTELKFAAEDGRPQGTLVVTDDQTAGKGRRGRGWAGGGINAIAFSLLLRPEYSTDKAPMVTLIMALAVAEVLSKLTELDVKIKWPNDVVINKKKVCGILTEMALKPDHTIDHIIIGVGINVNQKEFPEEISDIATSLFIEKGERYSRSTIILAIMEFFEYYYDIFVQSGDLSDIVALYDSFLVNRDAKVRVLDPKGEYTGTASGINDFGELIVQKEDGSFTRVSSGEVSVRGVYGYI